MTDGGAKTGAGQVVLVTGMSGAGRTAALKALEDLGFEAVDNLPLRLLTALGPPAGDQRQGLAIGVDIRARDFSTEAILQEVARLKTDPKLVVRVLFLDCDEETLRRRYTETRRRHPLAEDRPLLHGIARERRLLAPLRAAADLVVDTSHTHLPEFSRILRSYFASPGGGRARVFVTSFAYRNGLPRDADLVFDVRFLKNPHYDPNLRPLSGLDAAVGRAVEADPDYAPLMAAVLRLLELALPRFDAEGKSYLTIAFGCSGGRHRSVHVAEQVAAWIRGQGRAVHVQHRDLLPGGAGEGDANEAAAGEAKP